MDILNIIGLVGSLVSIGAAIWSIFNVGIIKKTKQEIFSKLKIVKYSGASSISKNTINQLRKIANREKIPRGLNTSEIIDSLNDYYESLNELRVDLEEDGFVKLKEYMSTLKSNITSVSRLDRSDPELFKQKYEDLYYYILEIDTEIGKLRKNIVEK